MKNLEIGQDAILITGPTASGKSAFAVEMAKRYNGVVINADSMQVYDTLHVLTARPFEQDMQGIAHHLYGHVPVSQLYSTGEWFRDAVTVLQAVRGEGRIPVLHSIPILGHLFKTHNVGTQHDELLIFITPRIVRG